MNHLGELPSQSITSGRPCCSDVLLDVTLYIRQRAEGRGKDSGLPPHILFIEIIYLVRLHA